MRIVVDFPEPFGPRKPVTTPGETVKLRSLSATVFPYRLVSPRVTIMDSLRLPGPDFFRAACLPSMRLRCRVGNAATGRPGTGGSTSRGAPVRLDPSKDHGPGRAQPEADAAGEPGQAG
jgi:hypothetical protein